MSPFLQRVLGTFTSKESAPWLGADDQWCVHVVQTYRLPGRWFGVWAVRRTAVRRFKGDVRNHWPAEVRERMDQELARAVASGELAKVRWHWDKWAARGRLRPASDAELRQLIEKGGK